MYKALAKILAVITLLTGMAVAQQQAVQHCDLAATTIGSLLSVLPSAKVRVCDSGYFTPNQTAACTPLRNLYTDITATTIVPNPVIADNQGNFCYFAAPGYVIQQTCAVGGKCKTQKLYLPPAGGATGATGPGVQIAIQSIATTDGGAGATITPPSGNPPTQMLSLTIPRGEPGPPGPGGGSAEISLPNDTTTGTSQYKLTKLTSTGSAIIASVSDLMGVVGICNNNCGTSGSAVLGSTGIQSCVFDGLSRANDTVTLSSTNDGECHDFGSQTAPPTQCIGRALSNHGAAGTYQIIMDCAAPAPVTPISLSFNETPFGTIDGTNAAFGLARVPTIGTLMLYRNGLLQTAGVHYTIVSNTITFQPTFLPKSGDTLLALYQY